MVTGPNINRAVTDTAYLCNSGMNPYEAGKGRLVQLDKGDFIDREALARIHEEGPKRQTVGLLFDRTVPRLVWNWPLTDVRGSSGEVRLATISASLWSTRTSRPAKP